MKIEDIGAGGFPGASLDPRIGQHDGTDPSGLAGDIEGLKIEEDGRISFHGPTSLFQLPSGLAPENPNPMLAEQCADGRKERLINNAWRERAFEQLTTIPVCSDCIVIRGIKRLNGIGTFPISPRLALVLDTPPLQLRLSSGFYSYVIFTLVPTLIPIKQTLTSILVQGI